MSENALDQILFSYELDLSHPLCPLKYSIRKFLPKKYALFGPWDELSMICFDKRLKEIGIKARTHRNKLDGYTVELLGSPDEEIQFQLYFDSLIDYEMYDAMTEGLTKR